MDSIPAKETKEYNNNTSTNSFKEIKDVEVPIQNIGGQNQTGNNYNSNENQNLPGPNPKKSNLSNISNDDGPFQNQTEVHNSFNQNFSIHDSPVIFYIIDRIEEDMSDLGPEK